MMPGGDDENGEDLTIDLTRTIFIYGILHTISNCTKDLGKGGLQWYDKFLEYLTHICRLLSRRWSKSRLLETCFRDPPVSLFSREVIMFNYVVFPSRWGSVLMAAEALIELRLVLRRAWSMQRFTFNGARDNDEEQGDDAAAGEARVKVRLVDEAVTSKLFWGFLVMVSFVGKVLLYVTGWAEG